MAEFFRGKGWFLKLSRVSILHSIMLNFDCVYDKHFVYRGKTKHLWQALTNGLHAAIVKIWELARGQTKYLRQALTNGFTAAIVTMQKLLR